MYKNGKYMRLHCDRFQNLQERDEDEMTKIHTGTLLFRESGHNYYTIILLLLSLKLYTKYR